MNCELYVGPAREEGATGVGDSEAGARGGITME